MPDQDPRFRPQRGDQAGHVPGQGCHVIGRDSLRLAAAAIAAHVDRDDLVSGIGNRSHLVAPRVPAFRKAVHHHDQWPLANSRNSQFDTIRGHILELDAVEDAGHGGAPVGGVRRVPHPDTGPQVPLSAQNPAHPFADVPARPLFHGRIGADRRERFNRTRKCSIRRGRFT